MPLSSEDASQRLALFEQRIINETASKLMGLFHKALQVNIGNRCNQLCTHCHVKATPADYVQTTFVLYTEILVLDRTWIADFHE